MHTRNPIDICLLLIPENCDHVKNNSLTGFKSDCDERKVHFLEIPGYLQFLFRNFFGKIITDRDTVTACRQKNLTEETKSEMFQDRKRLLHYICEITRATNYNKVYDSLLEMKQSWKGKHKGKHKVTHTSVVCRCFSK